MKIALEHIHKVTKRLANGTLRDYYFHRLTRKKIEGEPGTLAFFSSYEKAAIPDEVAIEGTFKDLIAKYIVSNAFTKNAPRTQSDYLAKIKIIEARFGQMPIEALRDKRIKGKFIEWRDELAVISPKNADYCLNVLKAIIKLAVDKNVLDTSYVHGIPNVYKGDRSDMIWQPEQVAAVLEKAKPTMKTAIIMALSTGQRSGDLISFKWEQEYKNGRFAFRQNKRGRFVNFPATPLLRETLTAVPRVSEFILTTQTGNAWHPIYFSQEFGDARKAAGISGLTFNDFRGTAVTVLWEAGSNEAEIASITGHSLHSVSDILERYTSRTGKMSASAMLKMAASWIGNIGAAVNQPVN